jgi:hypothetical protein
VAKIENAQHITIANGLNASIQKDGTVLLRLSAAKVHELIRKAGNGMVVLDFSSLSDVSVVQIPGASFRAFAKAGLAVDVVFPQGAVAMDNETVTEITKKVWNRHVTVEMDDKGDFNIKSGRRVINI